MTESSQGFEDFKSRIQLAKLDPNDLQLPSFRLKFHSQACTDNFSLMQVNNDMLQLIEEGNSLVIRGDTNDSAVLCTDCATFDVKNASTSNTLVLFDKLVCPDAGSSQTEELFSDDNQLSLVDKTAVAWKFNYFELKQVNPLTPRLLELVKLAPYKGPQCEEENNPDQMFSLSDLQNTVQASEVEILQKLTELNCCCIGGKWRFLDFGFTVECMGEMLQLIEAESWSCGRVPVEEMCLKINDSGELVPSFIVKHLLSAYGTQFTEDDGLVYYRLNERKICRFFAEMLLKDVGRFNYSEFLEIWKESVPAGMTTDEKFLEGLALVDDVARQTAIFLFKVEDLPLDFDARFDVLFQNREKWTLEQITPYIEDVCLKGQTVPSLLTKYARSSTLNGVKVFSTRKLR